MIKGRYVALVEVDFCVTEAEDIRPIEDMRSDYANGVVDEVLKNELEEIFTTKDRGYTTVKVTRQYADVIECPEEGEEE